MRTRDQGTWKCALTGSSAAQAGGAPRGGGGPRGSAGSSSPDNDEDESVGPSPTSGPGLSRFKFTARALETASGSLAAAPFVAIWGAPTTAAIGIDEPAHIMLGQSRHVPVIPCDLPCFWRC